MTSVPLPAAAASQRPALPVLVALSGAHLLNDVLQSLIPAIYPMLREAYRLDFAQIGLITLAFQVTSSLLQPLVGFATDRRPFPYAMVAGMGATLLGLLGLAFAPNYAVVLVAAALVGVGSAVFHPEATRMARHASAGQQGFAQGVFQIGGHAGYAAGPLLAAAVVIPNGQASLAWFSGVALAAMALMAWTAQRYVAMRGAQTAERRAAGPDPREGGLSAGAVAAAMGVLIVILFSKNAYGASFTSYYTFFLIERFAVSVQFAQVMLFLFLGIGVIGVVLGGMLGDRIGRERIILVSVVGPLPFALMLPYADLATTVVLSLVIQFLLASAFSAILIYAIDLMPHRVGLVGGVFYGLSFGLGGLAAAGLGLIADRIGIVEVFRLTAFLPAFGLLALLLPKRGAVDTR